MLVIQSATTDRPVARCPHSCSASDAHLLSLQCDGSAIGLCPLAAVVSRRTTPRQTSRNRCQRIRPIAAHIPSPRSHPLHSHPSTAMSKRAAQDDASAAAKKCKNGSAAASASATSADGAAHSGPSTHSHHGPLPLTTTDDVELSYLPGFGSDHQSEALPNSLPVGQNAPQVSVEQQPRRRRRSSQPAPAQLTASHSASLITHTLTCLPLCNAVRSCPLSLL